MNPFFELLQVAVGTREILTAVPDSPESWQRLLDLVAEHGVVGVTFPAIDAMTRKGLVPEDFFIPWGLVEQDIIRRNHRQRDALAILNRQFQESGFRHCLLKGQASGAYYPNPLLRQSGDIDIWLDGGHKAVMTYLRPRFKVYKTRYIHCDVKMLKGMRVEVHFTPSWMNGPIANRRLQQWFAAQANAQFSHMDPTLGCPVPTKAFNAVYMLLHIYRHLLEEGIGLRQLMDYFYVLQHLTEEDKSAARKDLHHLRLYRFARAVMYVLREVFGMGEERMLCPPDDRNGVVLLEAILQSGNFGYADPVFANEESRHEGILAHGWRKIKRNARFLRLCPSEVLWMPFFVTWQYFWRRKHGYLYKGR